MPPDAANEMPVLVMFIVTAVETVGDISGVMEGGMGREATDKELSGGVACDVAGLNCSQCQIPYCYTYRLFCATRSSGGCGRHRRI